MGRILHYKETGETAEFREFDESLNVYISPSLSEREMSLYLMSTANPFNPGDIANIPQRLERAKTHGASELLGPRRKDSWEESESVYWGPRYSVEKTTEAFLADVERRLDLPLRELI